MIFLTIKLLPLHNKISFYLKKFKNIDSILKKIKFCKIGKDKFMDDSDDSNQHMHN